MDNHLTPNKIQRLIKLAEDRSFRREQRLLPDITESPTALDQNTFNQTGTNCLSSGILDLDQIEGFGESGLASISLSKSNVFNPGEMTGRSTEADSPDIQGVGSSRAFEEYGRHSLSIDNITSNMDKQTSEIHDLMRNSIMTNASFQSKRDLTASEVSFAINDGLPMQHSTKFNIPDSMSSTTQNISAYFNKFCPELREMLCKNIDSPDRPSITEVSSVGVIDASQNNINGTYKLDQTLDSVPVRQPRQDKPIPTNLFPAINSPMVMPKPQNADSSAIFAAPRPQNADITNKRNTCTLSKGPALQPCKTTNQNASRKPFMSSSKPTDILLRNLHSTPFMTDDAECSMENSLSISKIADYLGKQSNVSVSEMLQLNKQAKPAHRKQPLTELQLNILENTENNDPNRDICVTNLRDTKNADTASSSGTVNTVISLDKLKISEKSTIPKVMVSRESANAETGEGEKLRSPRMASSKSPVPSRSPSTRNTAQDITTSFKAVESPLSSSKGDANASRFPSPTIKYSELDSSVDWEELRNELQGFTQKGLPEDQLAEITTSRIEGFVGVSVAATISVTTLVDNWLTARFEFDDIPNLNRDLSIELPRFPLLLSPRKTERFTISITSNTEMNKYLPFTLHFKDSSMDRDDEYKGNLEVSFKLPVIQALSCDGVNKVTFPPIQEKASVMKHFVLISDCPVDLQLELSITMGESLFVIKSVQEIKKSDVNKVLMDRSGCVEEVTVKTKKGINKQLCRLSSGNAIKVAITFSSPKLSELEMTDQSASFTGTLTVALIGISTVLKRLSLVASVGSASLAVQPPVGKLLLTNEPTTVSLCNTGSVAGVWAVKFRSKSGADGPSPFKVSANTVEIRPGGVCLLKLVYVGPPDVLNEGTLILEEKSNDNISKIEVTGGSDRPKSFPIKTNYKNMTFVRAERKELSLKNSTDQRIQIRCQIIGEGFTLDCPGIESRGTIVLSFGPCERRPLHVVFAPSSCLPHAAALHLVFDKSSDYSKKILLHGCASNDAVRWSGLIKYGDAALVRAVSRSDIELKLLNKAAAPAFLAARVHFNLQYRFIEAESALLGARRVLGRRCEHALLLRVPWARLERRARTQHASTLATVTVLTGPEFTRRRILRILRSESSDALDLSLLPDNLRVLAEPFEMEDPDMDSHLEKFNETKASLNELIEGLQELTAQIDLPQDFADDHTIIITDDTVLEHHTLCD